MDRALKGKDIMMSNNHRDPPKPCPRCESTNTKFCYFNNYSQSQPRHFCRACRRYWTEGGTLRNVPQGGGSYRRGNKRSRRAPPPQPAPATTGSEVSIAVTPPPQPPPAPAPFIFGGGDGMMTAVFQPFHPAGCAGMTPDFLGFNSASDPMMPGFFNLPMHPPMQPPVFDTNLMIGQQPRLAVTSHQQMNITVFTSSTAAAAAGSNVSSAGAGNGEGYWNEFNNEGEKDDSSQPPTP